MNSVPKYEMPTSEYATRSDSVLAWKKANKLGRFDPHAADAEAAKKEAAEREIRERGELENTFHFCRDPCVPLPLRPWCLQKLPRLSCELF